MKPNEIKNEDIAKKWNWYAFFFTYLWAIKHEIRKELSQFVGFRIMIATFIAFGSMFINSDYIHYVFIVYLLYYIYLFGRYGEYIYYLKHGKFTNEDR